MSKRLRYQVAVSLDGFIAGPNGEYDWIVMDPSIDFNETLPSSGIVALSYSVVGAKASGAQIAWVKPAKKRVTARKKSKAARRKRP